jgi:hypothetical protein
MAHFVNKNSIIRKIWGSPDTTLFIFAGAAAEFAVNKAVDWLYFTGRLPADPLARLFSTVVYSQKIIFSELEDAHCAIDQVTAIHKGVEENRSAQIPDWAYRDVLFMLIAYSVSSFEVLQRKLSNAEKEEIFDVFYRVGLRMGLKDLPKNYSEWVVSHHIHLKKDTVYSEFTIDLYRQYRKHLGDIRYWLLKQVQVLIVPKRVNELLSLGNKRYLIPILWLYKLSRSVRLDEVIITAVLPQKYKDRSRG